MSNVAVLGGNGFVGRHLCRHLRDQGHKVTVVMDDYSRNKKKAVIEGVDEVKCDASNAKILHYQLENRDIDTVYNLTAAVGGIYFNIDHQLDQMHRNSFVQVAPLVAAEEAGVKRFLQVSSVCIYDWTQMPESGAREKWGNQGLPEKSNFGYGMAKRYGEQAALLSSIPHVVIVRPSNMAGPGDYYDEKAHVIPALIKRADEEETLKVYGNPNFVREFLHVQDGAEGMAFALEHGLHKEVYNLGSGNLISIHSLAHGVLSMGGLEKEIEWMGGEGGDPYRRVSITKMRALGWEAKRSMTKILEDSWADYRQRYP